jgi:fructose-bisphosphate aldolase class 1
LRSWFQAFAFKWVNLHRYVSGGYSREEAAAKLKTCKGMSASFSRALTEVGLCTLNQVDP